MNMLTKKIPIGKLSENPDNPRLIKTNKYYQLVKSLKEFPEMLKIRPIVVNKDHIILGGNMRYKASIEAGLKEVDVIKVDLSPEQEKEFIIKDNIGFGDWDWDSLGNEWDNEQLKEWGLDVWQTNDIDLNEFFDEAPTEAVEKKKDPLEWYNLFVDFVSENDSHLYNKACKYADDNE